jgi:RNA polymerase sigma-70 factor (ECF subfamily)
MADRDDPVELRPLLFSIADWTLSSVTDAEDIVRAGYPRYLDYLCTAPVLNGSALGFIA